MEGKGAPGEGRGGGRARPQGGSLRPACRRATALAARPTVARPRSDFTTLPPRPRGPRVPGQAPEAGRGRREGGAGGAPRREKAATQRYVPPISPPTAPGSGVRPAPVSLLLLAFTSQLQAACCRSTSCGGSCRGRPKGAATLCSGVGDMQRAKKSRAQAEASSRNRPRASAPDPNPSRPSKGPSPPVAAARPGPGGARMLVIHFFIIYSRVASTTVPLQSAGGSSTSSIM